MDPLTGLDKEDGGADNQWSTHGSGCAKMKSRSVSLATARKVQSIEQEHTC
jgi:hypothetical protein